MTANFRRVGPADRPRGGPDVYVKDAEGKKGGQSTSFISKRAILPPRRPTPFLPGNVAACWRGRCDAIEGFFLGALVITD
jgi:hypothetical protein